MTIKDMGLAVATRSLAAFNPFILTLRFVLINFSSRKAKVKDEHSITSRR
jgi:hypothetical protein